MGFGSRKLNFEVSYKIGRKVYKKDNVIRTLMDSK